MNRAAKDSPFLETFSTNINANGLQTPIAIHCANRDELGKIFDLALQYIKSNDIKAMILGLNTLINFISLIQSSPVISTQFFSRILSECPFEPLITHLTTYPNHPLLIRLILKFITKVITIAPQTIDVFLSSNFHDILLTLMPSKEAIKCIKKMFFLNENYRDLLLGSNFQKYLLHFIFQLRSSFIPSVSLFENDYISFLTEFQSYFIFDLEDYTSIVDLFFKNIIAHSEQETYAQESYIDFLLNSNDVNLLSLVCHRTDDLIKVFQLYLRPAYGKVKSKVLSYFNKIILLFPEFAPAFVNPPHLIKMLSTDNHLDKTESVVRFVFSLCNVSQEICEQLMTFDLFSTLINMFSTLNAALKYQIYMVLVLLVNKYPPTCEFYAYFNNPEMLGLFKDNFLEYTEYILEGNDPNKNVVLDFLMIIVERAANKNSNLFVGVLFQQMLMQHFYETIQNLTLNEDETISEKAKVLCQKFEELI